MAVTVLIVDDHAPFREAARAVVEATAGFEVVAEAASGEDSVLEAVRLKPDLVLMDVHLPGIDGPTATRSIRDTLGRVVVLLLSTHDPEDYATLAPACGAAAYVHKVAFGPETLREVWRAADT